MSKLVKVLAIDDEEDILDLLKYNFNKEGYDIKTANNGKKGIEIAKDFIPDVVLLDIMMPGIDGVETCRQLREIPKLNNSFIIFLTARAEEYSEIAAFDNGADDYIIKPIKPRALLGRIAALIRRDEKEGQTSSDKKNEVVSIGGLVIDKSSYTVKKDNKDIALPKKEFDLLYYLATNPNKVFNRDELLASIWGTDVYVLSRTVDVHIRKVREKVGEDLIQTIKGVGYKFNN